MRLDDYNLNPVAILVKIFDSDKEKKNISPSGLIVTNMHRPLANSVGVGKVISVGSLVRDIEENDILLFHHSVEAEDSRFIDRDESGEYRIVIQQPMSDETMGVVKVNKHNQQYLLPMRGFIICEPRETDHLNYEKIMSSVFQIPASYFNPKDESIKGMNLSPGDWLVCEPYGSYEIELNRNVFWFVHTDSIVAVNKGMHELRVARKVTSDIIEQASGEKIVRLN